MNSSKQCYCADPATLLVPRRTLSALIATIMLAMVAIFTAGYFLGKQTAIKEFAEHLQRQTFADQVSHALQTLFPQSADESAKETTSASAESEQPQEASVDVAEKVQSPKASSQPITGYHQALLFGGKRSDVEHFVSKMQAKGFPVITTKRSSRSAKGNVIHWYQATTQPYADLNELLHVIDQIKQQERLANVQIVKVPTA